MDIGNEVPKDIMADALDKYPVKMVGASFTSQGKRGGTDKNLSDRQHYIAGSIAERKRDKWTSNEKKPDSRFCDVGANLCTKAWAEQKPCSHHPNPDIVPEDIEKKANELFPKDVEGTGNKLMNINYRHEYMTLSYKLLDVKKVVDDRISSDNKRFFDKLRTRAENNHTI